MSEAEPSSDGRTALECMLEARSVAVVGASVKEGSLGRQMLIELRRGGYDGEIFPVNPGYEEIDGLRCYPSVGDAPGPVDLAMLGVANARLEDALRGAAEAGARSALTFASLYEEVAPGVTPLPERLGAIARGAGMAFCGGNCMGFLNIDAGLRATGFATPDEIRAGPVTLISHSGSVFAAFSFNDRGIGFDLLVSPGQEIVTTMAEYMAFALERETTRVIALLVETVRDPEVFRRALAEAASREIPVVALKVGRTERSKAMVTAHSGALAGEHGAFEALFDAFGVHEVRTLDEMADTLELFSAPRRVRSGRGIASVMDSGGERVMFVDLANDLGVPFAAISDATQDGDAGGAGSRRGGGEPVGRVGDRHRRRPDLPGELPSAARRPGHGGRRVRRRPLAAGRAVRRELHRDLARRVRRHHEAVLRAVEPAQRRRARGGRDPARGRHPRAGGHRERAAGIAASARRGRAPRPSRSRCAGARADEVRDRWRARLTTGEEISELEGLALLADYGVPVVPALGAASADEAVAAAAELGWPVVLKTAAPGVQHKSDVGGVIVGVVDEEAHARARTLTWPRGSARR